MRIEKRKVRIGLIAVMAAMSGMAGGHAWAGTPGGTACVDVEVNGERAPSYTCLTQQLTPSRDAKADERGLASESIANRPSNQLGLYNRAATEHRMGNTFGTSVLPQRPPNNPQGAPVVPGSPLK